MSNQEREGTVKGGIMKALGPGFLFAAALLAGMLVMGFFLIRFFNFRKQKRKLEALVDERTRQLKKA